MGGLARKATYIDNLYDSDINPLILDAGNLFYKNEIIDPGITLETAKVNAEIIAKSYGVIGCNAFSPGSYDFAAGLDNLLVLEEKSKIDFISCNLYKKTLIGKDLLFAPYKIIETNNLKVGVVGLISAFNSDEIIIEDPIQSLNDIIDEVDKVSDIVILLFNATEKDLNRLYSQNYNIDLIIKSKGRTRSADGGSKTPTFICGDRGKLLYQINMNLYDNSLPFVDIAWCENTIERSKSRLDKMKKGDLEANLYEVYRNDQATLNRINSYKSQIQYANNLLTNAVNTITFDKIEMNKEIYDKPSILKIVDKGKLKIKDMIGPDLIDHKGRLPGDPHYNHGH